MDVLAFSYKLVQIYIGIHGVLSAGMIIAMQVSPTMFWDFSKRYQLGIDTNEGIVQ